MPSFRGKPCCQCLAESLPVVERVMLAQGLIRHGLDVYQCTGSAPQSAGTHSKGGAVDTAQFSDAQLRVWRDMGYDAAWHRRTSQGFDIDHCHAVARGCPHNGPARYQIDAVDAGYNGLGNQGHGGKDDGPRPLSGRTWQEGIEWAKAQVGNVSPSDPFTYRHVEWNTQSPRYGPPWAPRGEQIGALIAAQNPDVVTVQETWASTQTATLLRHLDGFAHVSSPTAGTDIFYRSAVFAQTRPAVEYPMKVQGRAALVLHLQHRSSGRPLTIVNTHAPALVPAYRTVYARNLVRLLGQVDGPIVLAGDFNNASRAKSPHKELAAAGFVAAKVQAELVHENEAEYPKKNQWLADVLTKPRDAQVIGGELVRTPARLSDHRMISVQVRA